MKSKQKPKAAELSTSEGRSEAGTNLNKLTHESTSVSHALADEKETKTLPPMQHVDNQRYVRCHGHTVPVTSHNKILLFAICNITNGDHIVAFTGNRVNSIFDLNRKRRNDTYLSLNNKVPVRTWGEVSRLINETFARYKKNTANIRGQMSAATANKRKVAVHVHNHNKLGDFMLLMHTEYQLSLPRWRSTNQRRKEPLSEAQFHAAFDKGQPPIVLTNVADENWGILSTRKYRSLELSWEKHRTNMKHRYVPGYLHRAAAVITTQPPQRPSKSFLIFTSTGTCVCIHLA